MKLDTNLTLHVCMKINSKTKDGLNMSPEIITILEKTQELSTLILVMVMIFDTKKAKMSKINISN